MRKGTWKLLGNCKKAREIPVVGVHVGVGADALRNALTKL